MAVGKIYCGCCSYKRVNGYFKIGMTMQGVGTRASQIRKTDVGFEILDFVKFPKINKEKLMFIESYVRLVMSKAEGSMACDPYYMERPDELLPLLAETVRMLWNVDISSCPRKRTLDTVLKEARYRVENDMVDVDDVEPETYGEGGFKDPYELLSWLETNRPEEELVFSHGDLCLPNIFFRDGKLSGLIDLGNAGVCDKWQDLALCYRSLKHNANGSYAKVYPGINEDELFELLGIEPDNEKLRYYILLDELF